MLSREDVVAAYRLILGREPESDAVIEHHRERPDLANLRAAMIGSDEFVRDFKLMNDSIPYVPTAQVMPPQARIDLPDDPGTLSRMFAQTGETWRRLGEERPHHSVMGLEEFLPGTYEENAAFFEETGEEDMILVDAALDRLEDREAITRGLCVEIGCGVCRIAIPMSRRFDRVLGVDSSPTHLARAREALDRHGVGNVELRRVSAVEDYGTLPEAQFILSRFVLHHNPPPVQMAILRHAISRLASPGALMFQTVTHIDNYSFDADEYLSQPRTHQETHAVPQRALFELFRDTGLSVVEVQRDDTAAAEPWLRSFVYLVRRS